MELKELIHPLEVLEVVGNTDVEISGIQSDSRKVEKGFLFVAVRGTTVDGHDYIQSAIGKGAAAIVCEEIPALSDEDIQVSESKPVFIRVKDSADALGKSLSAFGQSDIGWSDRHERKDDNCDTPVRDVPEDGA